MCSNWDLSSSIIINMRYTHSPVQIRNNPQYHESVMEKIQIMLELSIWGDVHSSASRPEIILEWIEAKFVSACQHESEQEVEVTVCYSYWLCSEEVVQKLDLSLISLLLSYQGKVSLRVGSESAHEWRVYLILMPATPRGNPEIKEILTSCISSCNLEIAIWVCLDNISDGI